MNKAKEVKFLIALYEKIEAANDGKTKRFVDTLFCKEVEKLIDSNDIDTPAFKIAKSIFDIESNSLIDKVNESSKLTRNVVIEKTISKSEAADPCGGGYSGSRGGGC